MNNYNNDGEDAASPDSGTVKFTFILCFSVYLLLFWYASLYKHHQFSPDSMNYVDVANNIVAKRGIVQSTLGFNDPRFLGDEKIPSPMVGQPPMYPILIALVSYFGVWVDNAALTISSAGYGLVLFGVYLLIRRLYYDQVAVISMAALVVYYPLYYVAGYAWSETLGLAFVVFSLWLLLIAEDQAGRSGHIILLAGLLAGLAFATRYLFVSIVFVGIILLTKRENRYIGYNVVLYLGGFATVACLLIFRNVIVSQTLVGHVRNPSNVNVLDNVLAAGKVLVGGYLDPVVPAVLQALLCFIVVSVFIIRMIRSSDIFYNIIWLMLARSRYVLPLWSIVYLVLLLIQRSRVHADPVNARLIVPAGIFLVVFVVATGLQGKTRLMHIAILLVLIRIIIEMNIVTSYDNYSKEDTISSSERLLWLRDNTTSNSLVIGDDVVDIPFYLGLRDAVSFSPYPYTDYPDYYRLMNFVVQRCDKYDGVYLVMKDVFNSYSAWENAFGAFIADLVVHRSDEYSAIAFKDRLDDGYIFQIECS
jgi:hypothetical protein